MGQPVRRQRRNARRGHCEIPSKIVQQPPVMAALSELRSNRSVPLPDGSCYCLQRLREGSMPDKGPRVFLDYDQAALDAAYDQAVYAANREQLIKRRVRDTELTRRRIGKPEQTAQAASRCMCR